MREQFEKLPEIANKIQYGAGSNKLRFNKEAQEYYCHTSSMQGMDNALFVNGAWYAFQEQQKRIDGLNLKIQDLINKYESKTTLPILDQWSDCFVKSARGVVNDLKELLK